MRRGVWTVGLWLVGLVSAILFVLPGDTLPDTGERAFPHADKVEHALAFAALAFLARRATEAPRWLVFAALGTYGGLVELLQLGVPGRSADALDWIADLLGAAVGALL